VLADWATPSASRVITREATGRRREWSPLDGPDIRTVMNRRSHLAVLVACVFAAACGADGPSDATSTTAAPVDESVVDADDGVDESVAHYSEECGAAVAAAAAIGGWGHCGGPRSSHRGVLRFSGVHRPRLPGCARRCGCRHLRQQPLSVQRGRRRPGIRHLLATQSR
jgi:hypothetical protein